jgi:uncharacterized protein YjcR
MSSFPLDIRRQAKSLVEAGKTSAEVGVLLDIKPGTVREWKRRYMWDGPKVRIGPVTTIWTLTKCQQNTNES